MTQPESLALRDVREGGRWSPAQRAKNDLLYAAATVALAVAVRLPPPLLRGLGRTLGALAHAALPGPRRLARSNVARALPELDARARARLVRRTYLAFGEHLADVVATLDPARPPPLLPFAPGARAVLDDALAEGRGVLFASAHLGPWERVAASLVAGGLPLTVVAREAYDPRLTPIYDRLRGGHGVRTIYRASPGAAAALLRTLRRGHLLGIPMDLASRVPSVDVPLLGHAAPTPVGPARLALRTGAAVVVGTAAKDGDLIVIAARRIPTADLLDDARSGRGRAVGEGAARALTARINDELTSRIRAMPEHWPWMHPRWGPPRA